MTREEREAIERVADDHDALHRSYFERAESATTVTDKTRFLHLAVIHDAQAYAVRHALKKALRANEGGHG